MNWLMDISLFALLFFLLVFFHELGHFLMAKWVGIKVEKFSIGMGPSIVSFKKGDTAYRLAILPLGGYVKMAGDDPTKEMTKEEKRVGFLSQKPAAKLLVVFGGPLFNMILPIFIYALMLSMGISEVAPVVGTVEKDMPASQVGLISGDHILSIDGKPLRRWKELEAAVKVSAGKSLQLLVDRVNLVAGKDEKLKINITPKLSDAKSRYGEDIKVGKLGISPAYPLPQVYYENPNSTLAKAGIKTFDRITQLNGLPVTSLEQWKGFIAEKKGTHFQLGLKRNSDSKVYQAEVDVPKGRGTIGKRIGVLPVDLVIGFIKKGGEADKAGMKVDDRLAAIDGKTLKSWKDVPDIIRSSKGKKMKFVWFRNGKKMTADFAAEKTVRQDPLLGKDDPLAHTEIYRVGISPKLAADTDLITEQSYNPVRWLKKGVAETWDVSAMTLTALGKLVTGKISLKLLGSPIMIYKVAGTTYRMAGGGERGWIAFLMNLVLLSVTLGLVNLIPIPILDGGHAMFFTIEWIRGKPVSIKVMEVATQIGLFIIITLFALVVYNDVNRYGFLDPVLRLFH